MAAFTDGAQYYATLAHELGHWTRHPSRLNRDFGQKRFADHGYALEELVAEMCAAFVGADHASKLMFEGDVTADACARPAEADRCGRFVRRLRGIAREVEEVAHHAVRASGSGAPDRLVRYRLFDPADGRGTPLFAGLRGGLEADVAVLRPGERAVETGTGRRYDHPTRPLSAGWPDPARGEQNPVLPLDDEEQRP